MQIRIDINIRAGDDNPFVNRECVPTNEEASDLVEKMIKGGEMDIMRMTEDISVWWKWDSPR